MHKNREKLAGQQKRIEELEAELAESRARFRIVTDNSYDGIALLEHERIIYISQFFLRVFDIEADDNTVFNIHDIISRIYEEDRERVSSIIKESKNNKKQHHHYEYRIKKKDGSIVWIENYVVREYDAQGVNCRTLVNGRDITEQKALFEKLRRSEETFKTIFNKSNAVKLIIDLETGNVENANNAAVTFYGYPRETLLTKHIADINTLSAEEISQKMRQAGQKAEGVFNFTHTLANGETRNVRVYSAPIEIDGRKKLVSHIYDITDRIEIEEELKENRAFLEETGNIAKVGGWFFDVKTGEGKGTEKLFQIYGIDSSTKLTIENTLKYYPPEVQHLIPEAFEKAIHEGAPIDVELPMIDANGSHKWVHSIGRAIYENGEVTKLIGAVQDITRRKELQLDLEATLKALPDLLFELDLKGTIIDYQAPRTEFLYLPPDKFINKCVFDILPPEAAEIIKKGFDNFVQNGEENRTLYSLPIEGTVHWFEMAIAEKSGFSYNERRFICLVRDITDRIEAEKELKESRELLRDTGRMAKVGGWSFREGVDYVYWSEEVCLLFEVDTGYKPSLEEAINYWHPEHRPIITKAVEELLQEGKSYDLELKIVTAKENEGWLHTIGGPIYEGDRIIGAKGIVQDITDRKTLEIELLESEKRLRLAMESAGDGIWDWNIKNNEVYFSPGWKEMLGYKDSEIIPSFAEWERLVHPDDKENALADVEATFMGKHKVYNNIHRLLCADGSYRWILARGQVIEYDENGKPSRLIGTHTDLTDQMETEEALRQSETQLLALNRTKDKLISIIGHDLKNPIHGIKGSASIILDRCEKKDCNPVPKLTMNIHKSARNALGILEDLLTWSKAQSGKLEKMPVNISVLDTVNDTILPHQASADKKNITIDVNIDPGLRIFADQQMFSAVFRNLISNAIKFTHKGGSITVTAEEKKDAVEFLVTDTGVGIERDMIRKLFRVGENISTIGTEQEREPDWD